MCRFIKIGLRKWNSWILISKMSVKMNFRIITKNHAADSKIGSSQKSILEPMGLTSPTRQPGSETKMYLSSLFKAILGENSEKSQNTTIKTPRPPASVEVNFIFQFDFTDDRSLVDYFHYKLIGFWLIWNIHLIVRPKISISTNRFFGTGVSRFRLVQKSVKIGPGQISSFLRIRALFDTKWARKLWK